MLQHLVATGRASAAPSPPLQNPASYNLDQVMQQVKDMKMSSHAGE